MIINIFVIKGVRKMLIHLSYCHAGSGGWAGGYPREHTSIGHTEVQNSPHTQLRVHYCHAVGTVITAIYVGWSATRVAIIFTDFTCFIL
jgi:hypothetical protein